MRGVARVRDPIHGTLRLSYKESVVLSHPAVQRLRNIKQLGLADLAYPGATHTRFSHALGVMHLAGRIFDTLAKTRQIEEADYQRLRTSLRLAALFHDLGHAPLSHATEALMPPVENLQLGDWLRGDKNRQATHEDYTLKAVISSKLTEVLKKTFEDMDVFPEDIAALLVDTPPAEFREKYCVDGWDWWPMLRQCVSSELDADRMDYLLRDSHYAGVPYGRYDLEWLLENLCLVEVNNDKPTPALHLGLKARATFGFEDFLLSRYHMFLAVYLHHVPVSYEIMLKKWYDSDSDQTRLPADIDSYLEWDDLHFMSLLKRNGNEWAQRIYNRRAYQLLEEHQATEEPDSLIELRNILKNENITTVMHEVRGQLSKYFNAGIVAGNSTSNSPQLYVKRQGEIVPLDQHVKLYRRYNEDVHLQRLYIPPEDWDKATAIQEQIAAQRS